MSKRKAAWILSAAVAAGLSGLATDSQAAPITWGAATQISAGTDQGVSNVSTNGVFKYAYNFGQYGNIAATVNGVSFASFTTWGAPSVTVGNLTLSASSGNATGENSALLPSTNGSGLAAEYQTLLKSAIGVGTNTSISLVMSGLTVGKTYAVQLWTNDSRGYGGGSTQIFSDASTLGNQVILSQNTGAHQEAGTYV